MIAYISAVIHPDRSHDFNRVIELAKATLESILANNGEFVVVIACNRKLGLEQIDQRIKELVLDLPPPTAAPDGRIPLRDMLLDKGVKLIAAAKFARQFEPRHYVAFDADDLVSNRLNEFLQNSQAHENWYIEQGFVWSVNSPHMKRTNNFYQYCGTSIVYARSTIQEVLGELDPPPTQGKDKRFLEERIISTFGDHHKARAHLESQGASFRAVPFPAAIWVRNTGLNHNEIPFVDVGLKITPTQLKEFSMSVCATMFASFQNSVFQKFVSHSRNAFLAIYRVWTIKQ